MPNPDQPPIPLSGAAPRQEASSLSPGRRIINSQELLGDDQEVLIQNGEEIYRLRRSRAGKLILYK